MKFPKNEYSLQNLGIFSTPSPDWNLATVGAVTILAPIWS